jgi:hypothetical protein
VTLTIERLRERLHYDATSGKFTVLVSAGRRVVGSEAGYINNLGYRQIAIDSKYYLAHRLAWFYVFEEWPDQEIDHINRMPADNRLVNLRPCTRSQNGANSVRHKNASGYRGVYWDKRGAWRAAIKKNGVRTYFGPFETAEEASAAYERAALELHGEFRFIEPPKPIKQEAFL